LVEEQQYRAFAALTDTDPKLKKLATQGVWNARQDRSAKGSNGGNYDEVTFLLFGSRLGLSIRSVGENPAAVDAAGVAVVPLRLACVTFGSVMAPLSGAFLTLVFVPTWSDGITPGPGWIAFAMVVFAAYLPMRVALFALLFGADRGRPATISGISGIILSDRPRGSFCAGVLK